MPQATNKFSITCAKLKIHPQYPITQNIQRNHAIRNQLSTCHKDRATYSLKLQQCFYHHSFTRTGCFAKIHLRSNYS